MEKIYYKDLKTGDLLADIDHGEILTFVAYVENPHRPTGSYADYYPTHDVVFSNGKILGVHDGAELGSSYKRVKSLDEGARLIDQARRKEKMGKFNKIEFVIRKHPITDKPAVFEVRADFWGDIKSLKFYSYDLSIVLGK